MGLTGMRLLALACLATFGMTQDTAEQDFSGADLGLNAEFSNNTQIRLFAAASSYANFTIPATFPLDAKHGDSIYVTVGLEISNPGESFDPRSGNAPESDLKSSELCQMSVALGDTILWVGELLPTFSVLQIGSNHSVSYSNKHKQDSLSIRQDCPNPSSEFLIHNATLTINKPISIYQSTASSASSTTTSIDIPSSTADYAAVSVTASPHVATVVSSGSVATTFGLYWLATICCFLVWFEL